MTGVVEPAVIEMTTHTRASDYLHPIANILGGTFDHRGNHWRIGVKNRQAGTVMVLQIGTHVRAVQAVVMRLTKDRPIVARARLEPFHEVRLIPESGIVEFSYGSRKFFRVSIDGQIDMGCVHIEQIVPYLPPARPLIARPSRFLGLLVAAELKQKNGLPVWSGGLSERALGRDETIYHPLHATGEAAVSIANRYRIGDEVEVWGTYAQKRDQARRIIIPRALVIVHRMQFVVEE
jgi:hypothetical protein